MELSKQIWTQTRAVFDLHVMPVELKVLSAILIKYTFCEIQQAATQSSSCVTSLSRALGHDKYFKTRADNGIKITVNLLDKE